MTGTPAHDEQDVAAPGQLEQYDDDLVDEIVKNLSEGRRHLSEWRQDARESYDFFAGKQWDEEDEAKLNDEGRPAVTFNRIPRTVNSVTGLEVQNRQEVRYFPRRNNTASSGDGSSPEINQSKLAELLTQASKWVRDQCDAEDEESEAFEDAIICGVGVTETRMDYEEDEEGKAIIERVDPLEMVFDPHSKKRNFADARWVARVREYTKKQFLELWPDHEDISSGLFWNDNEGVPHDADNDWKYENDQSNHLSKSNTVSVIQYQYFERVMTYKVLSQEGNLVDLEEERFNKIEKLIQNKELPYVKYPKRIYKECFLVGRTILGSSDLGCNNFKFNCITGLRDRNRNYWYGLVALMKDPQRWANKWLSQIQHIINTNAKGGLLVEEGALANPRKAEEDWAKPDAIITLRDGAISQGKILPREMPRYPEGIDRLLQYAIQAITDVTGVNLELIGMAERDQPIGLEQTRKQAGITILAVFFNSLRRYRKIQGRVLAYYIREYISDGRLIRIVGKDGEEYVPLMKDAVSFEYDIVVDDAPTSPNVKERTFAFIGQFVPMALQSGIPVPPDIIDYAPLPTDLITKWKKLITQNMNDPKKQQLEMIKNMLAALEVDQKTADIQKTQSDVTLNYAKSEQASAIGQDEAAQAQQKLGLASAEHQMKYEEMMKDQSRKDLEMLLNIRRKELESQIKMRNSQNPQQPVYQ